MKYKTLDNKTYGVNESSYKVNWRKPAPSQFQTKVRNFFYYIWGVNNHLVCEEFPVKPYLDKRYRLDLYNVTKRVAVEVHGIQHVQHVSHFNKTEDDFWAAVEKDSLKADFCKHNKIELVEIYPNDLPLSMKWLEKTYPNVDWELEY